MKHTSLLAIPLLALSLAPLPAAEVKLLPGGVSLVGPHASQRLVLLAAADGKFVADFSGDAKFASANPAVATVDEAGIVHAVADGETVITATHDGQQASVKVQVGKTKQPFN